MSRDDLLEHQRQDRRPRSPRKSARASPDGGGHRGQQSAGRDGAAGVAGDRLSAAAGHRAGRRAGHGPVPRVSGDGAERQRGGRFGDAAWAATATRWCRWPVAARWAASRSRTSIGPERLERDHPADARRRRGDRFAFEDRQRLSTPRPRPPRRWSRRSSATRSGSSPAPPIATRSTASAAITSACRSCWARAGVERIIEIPLSAGERAAFQKSVDAVKGLVETMARIAG